MINKIHITLISLFILTGCSGNMPTLGVNNGQLQECSSKPNCVNSQAKDDDHFIQAISFAGTAPETQVRLLTILNEWQGVKIVLTEEHYIQAEFVSKVFRFVDDVEFYFPEADAGITIIQVRSASRIGYSDLGVNRKRIEQIRSYCK